jgi:homoserine kinase
MTNSIPVGSGLGSSSSAIVAGLLGANALFGDVIPRNELLQMAVNIEGHPDNVAPALCGGLVLGVLPDDESGPAELVVRQWPPPELTAVVVLPDFNLLTSEARAVLPPIVPRGDAIFNASRLGLLIHVFNSHDYDLLRAAMGDRLHQTYRLHIIPGAAAAYEAAYKAGALGVALSGAGPSLIAFTDQHPDVIAHAMQNEFAAAGLSCRSWILKPTAQGACVIVDRG